MNALLRAVSVFATTLITAGVFGCACSPPPAKSASTEGASPDKVAAADDGDGPASRKGKPDNSHPCPACHYWTVVSAHAKGQCVPQAGCTVPPPVNAGGGADGCTQASTPCVCGNTGSNGRCGNGPLKGGLYCQCDGATTCASSGMCAGPEGSCATCATAPAQGGSGSPFGTAVGEFIQGASK